MTGKLVTREGHPALESTGSGQVFLLVEPGHGSSREPLTGETLERLKKASEGGARPLTVSGPVHGHAQLPPALAVESFVAAS